MGEPKAAIKAVALSKARENQARFFELMDADDSTYKGILQRNKWKTLADVLGVSESDFAAPKSKNHSFSLKTWRSMINGRKWVSRHKGIVAEHLLEGELICIHCYERSSRAGVLSTITTVIVKHEMLTLHQERSSESVAYGGVAGGGSATSSSSTASAVGGTKRRQLDLFESGVMWDSTAERQALAMQLCVGALVAGGEGAKAIPYSRLQGTLSADLLEVQRAMRSGFPGSTAIRTAILPKMVTLVKEWQDSEIKGKSFSLGLDAGSGKIVNGIRLIPLIALSAQLKYDMILDIMMLRAHETGEIQAKAIDDLFSTRKFKKKQLFWIGADNNSLNASTVRILNDKYGFNVELARCVDHCLNLVFVAILEPFEMAFSLQRILRVMRAYVKSGGGQSRRCMLVEHGIKLSGLDFTETRWTSYYKVIGYVMGHQTPRELKEARELLTELAADGDESAVEALKLPDVPRLRYDVILETLEAMGRDEKDKERRRRKAIKSGGSIAIEDGAGEIKEVRLNELLDSFASYNTFGAFYALHKMLGSVPALFKVMQGDERFEPAFDGLLKGDGGSFSGGRGDVISAIRSLINDLKSLTETDSPIVSVLLHDTEVACLQQAKKAALSAKENDEPLVPKDAAGKKKKSYDETDLPAFNEAAETKIEATMKLLRAAIISGSSKFTACAGMEKLNEALGDIELKSRFTLNKSDLPAAPKILHIDRTLPEVKRLPTSVKPLADFFGISPEKLDFDTSTRLSRQWELHRETLRKHHDEVVSSSSSSSNSSSSSPSSSSNSSSSSSSSSRSSVRIGPTETLDYYTNAKATTPDLTHVATKRLLRPNGNAAPERFVSILQDMDTNKVQSTKKETLYQVSFLRGNAPIVRLLLKEMAQELRVSKESHLRPSAKRAREDADLDARCEETLSMLLKTAWSSTLAKRRSSDAEVDEEVEVLSTVEEDEASEGGEAEFTFESD